MLNALRNGAGSYLTVTLDGVLAAQGFAVRVLHSDIGTAAFPAALAQVLGNGSYAAAARKVSVKLRARKRTPVQEAVGASLTPLTFMCVIDIAQVVIQGWQTQSQSAIWIGHTYTHGVSAATPCMWGL